MSEHNPSEAKHEEYELPPWRMKLGRKCIMGVMAMDKKTNSTPMTSILDRLRAYGEFKFVVFGNKLLLGDTPVEDWPHCDCLISFCSTGFPSHSFHQDDASHSFPHDKARAYVKLHHPFMVNDVEAQYILKSRPLVQPALVIPSNTCQVYRLLRENGIPVPVNAFVDRGEELDGGPAHFLLEHERGEGQEERLARVHKLVKRETVVTNAADHVVVGDVVMRKPLVEKPFNGGDHNITVYYGNGGSRRLFRKVKNRSSHYVPDVDSLRTDGSFMYEEFLKNGRDIKVYTLGPFYAHAETRKSPVVDGVVERDPDNKELRKLTRLTREEKEIAQKIVTIFKQNICGFDFIRCEGRSYVIDVNGWSFVKGNLRYYDKCARILRKLCLGAIHVQAAFRIPPSIRLPENLAPAIPPSQPVLAKKSMKGFQDGENKDVLRGIVAVFRHADRTPKQKVKIKTKEPLILKFFSSKGKEVKMKTRKPQQKFLKAVISVIAKIEKQSSGRVISNEERLLLSKFNQVCSVLKQKFGGTKVQLKPLSAKKGAPVERCLVVCKWGGEITHMGVEQTKRYAPIFWDEMMRPLPTVSMPPGVLPTDCEDQESEYLQKAFPHPNKDRWYHARRAHFIRGVQVYNSDELRVRETARIFLVTTLKTCKLPRNAGAINEGEHVQKFLDDIPRRASIAMDKAKDDISDLVASEETLVADLRQKVSDQEFIAILQAKEECGDSSSLNPSPTPVPSPSPQSMGDKAERAKSIRVNPMCAPPSPVMTTRTVYRPSSTKASRKSKNKDLYGLFIPLEPPSPTMESAQLPLQSKKRTAHSAMTNWGIRCLRWLNVPRKTLDKVYDLMKALRRQIHKKLRVPGLIAMEPDQAVAFEEYTNDAEERHVVVTSDESSREEKNGTPPLLMDSHPSNSPRFFVTGVEVEDGRKRRKSSGALRHRTESSMLCHNETVGLMRKRWDTLVESFYNAEHDAYNPTKIPDVYDCIKYDALHNQDFVENIRSLYRAVKRVADFVIPQEYGVLRHEKHFIGRAIVQTLLNRVVWNLQTSLLPDPKTTVTLYFSSEAHIHALRNTLLLSGLCDNRTMATVLESIELNYLSHGVFRLYEDLTKPVDDPQRFYVNVQFSPGAALDPFIFALEDHLLPVSRPVPICARMSWPKFCQLFYSGAQPLGHHIE